MYKIWQVLRRERYVGSLDRAGIAQMRRNSSKQGSLVFEDFHTLCCSEQILYLHHPNLHFSSIRPLTLSVLLSSRDDHVQVFLIRKTNHTISILILDPAPDFLLITKLILKAFDKFVKIDIGINHNHSSIIATVALHFDLFEQRNLVSMVSNGSLEYNCLPSWVLELS